MEASLLLIGLIVFSLNIHKKIFQLEYALNLNKSLLYYAVCTCGRWIFYLVTTGLIFMGLSYLLVLLTGPLILYYFMSPSRVIFPIIMVAAAWETLHLLSYCKKLTQRKEQLERKVATDIDPVEFF